MLVGELVDKRADDSVSMRVFDWEMKSGYWLVEKLDIELAEMWALTWENLMAGTLADKMGHGRVVDSVGQWGTAPGPQRVE